jgi:hypothetical protein
MKLLNLSNWLTSLVESFTFYGGGSGGGGGQTSKTTNELDPTVRPFVEYGLNEAKRFIPNSRYTILLMVVKLMLVLLHKQHQL